METTKCQWTATGLFTGIRSDFLMTLTEKIHSKIIFTLGKGKCESFNPIMIAEKSHKRTKFLVETAKER